MARKSAAPPDTDRRKEPIPIAPVARRAARKAPNETLVQLAEEIARLKAFVDEAAFSSDQGEMGGEIAQADQQHPADLADFTYQRELLLTTRGILEQEAQQLQDAMQRAARGEYGVCEECGRSIGAARLKARPGATLCIDCQRKREKRAA